MPADEDNVWYVYILRCSDNTLYTGISTDIERRLSEHNHDNRLGAKYTRARRPVELVFQQAFADRSGASQFECRIKAMSRAQKQQLINQAGNK